jgi:hypothetical protein
LVVACFATVFFAAVAAVVFGFLAIGASGYISVLVFLFLLLEEEEGDEEGEEVEVEEEEAGGAVAVVPVLLSSNSITSSRSFPPLYFIAAIAVPCVTLFRALVKSFSSSKITSTRCSDVRSSKLASVVPDFANVPHLVVSGSEERGKGKIINDYYNLR